MGGVEARSCEEDPCSCTRLGMFTDRVPRWCSYSERRKPVGSVWFLAKKSPTLANNGGQGERLHWRRTLRPELSRVHCDASFYHTQSECMSRHPTVLCLSFVRSGRPFEERGLKSVMRSHVTVFGIVPVAGSHFQSCVEKKQQALTGVSTFRDASALHALPCKGHAGAREAPLSHRQEPL